MSADGTAGEADCPAAMEAGERKLAMMIGPSHRERPMDAMIVGRTRRCPDGTPEKP
jgi:hypothetical protein